MAFVDAYPIIAGRFMYHHSDAIILMGEGIWARTYDTIRYYFKVLTMAMTPEGKLKKQVKDYLRSVGAWWYMPVQNGMGVVGIPDFIVCYRGMLLGIETKAPLKNPTTREQRWKKATPNQQNRITEIRESGGVAEVVDDVEQVVAMIKQCDVMIALQGSND